MEILTINTGSSSVRLDIYIDGDEGLAKIASKHIESDLHEPDRHLKDFALEAELVEPEFISHRIVHGAESYIQPTEIDEEVEDHILRLAPLAPLHNPIAVEWLRGARRAFGSDPVHIGVFDTAFFAAMPAAAKVCALPREFETDFGIKRYGFQGLAHASMHQRWQALSSPRSEAKVITIQLGSGCSMTAIAGGRAIDTSMGFSPLEGLIMATRPGDLDPGIIPYLVREKDMTIKEIEKIMSRSSGLLGISGISPDIRELLPSRSPNARLAIAAYCYRVRKYIGAYLAALGGADAIVFGGGVGENSPEIRKTILDGMAWCGIKLDSQANEGAIGCDGRIDTMNGSVELWTIKVDESKILAESALELIEAKHMKAPSASLRTGTECRGQRAEDEI